MPIQTHFPLAEWAMLQEIAARSPRRQKPHGAVGGTKQKQRWGWGLLVGFFVFVGVIAWLAYPSTAILSQQRWQSTVQFR